MVKNTVMIYACGGASINILSTMASLNKKSPQSSKMYATFDVAFIDTSHANIDSDIRDVFYYVEGRGDIVTDGSGKVRRTNLPAIQRDVPDILQKFPPSKLNIVVSSASGGTGATAAPAITSELLARGENVVVIMIGSSTCIKEIDNTIDTISSYKKISEIRKVPVIAHYLDNSSRSMKENDVAVRTFIMVLLAMWSGNNKGLDSMDLTNFLNYHKVTSYPIDCVGISALTQSQIKVEKGQPIATMISLVKDEDPNPGIMVGYHSFGILPNVGDSSMMPATPVNVYTTVGYFSWIISQLQKMKHQAEEIYRVNPPDTFTVTKEATDDGLVV